MKAKIWKWFGSDYRAHVSPDQYRKLMTWKRIIHGSTYTYPDGSLGYDVQFPDSLFPKVRRFLGG